MSISGDVVTEAEIRRQYSILRSRRAAGTPLTLLHIGAEETIVATGSESEAAAVLLLAIGAEKTGKEFFHHAPPTPAEIEYAINVVEDEVTGLFKRLHAGSELFTTDASLREIALHAGVLEQQELTLSLTMMEAYFNRLAALFMGRSAVQDDLPLDAAFAARLLILREFMHHLGFASIHILLFGE